MVITDAVRARFWAKVNCKTKSECWEFLAFKDKDGYGRFSIGGNDMSAQRAAWIVAVGPIPKGMHVLHDCDNPPCCNPAHLFLGTHTDNMSDARRKKRWSKKRPSITGDNSPKRRMAHCKHGHLYDAENTAWSKQGHRICRTCVREATAKYRDENRTKPKSEVHYNALKSHCAQGHEYNDANTYWYRGKWRQCRECNNARRRKIQVE